MRSRAVRLHLGAQDKRKSLIPVLALTAAMLPAVVSVLPLGANAITTGNRPYSLSTIAGRPRYRRPWWWPPLKHAPASSKAIGVFRLRMCRHTLVDRLCLAAKREYLSLLHLRLRTVP